MATTLVPNLPLTTVPWIDSQGRPTPSFGNYMTRLSQLKHPGGQLVDAPDDAAAAAAGVLVGELYRNGSVVMVRVA